MAQHEYCVWATPYLRWLREPLGVLALTAIAALLCGLFVAPQGFVVFAAVIAVITIGCAWPWIGIRGVSCQLSFANDRTEEGKPVEALLVIANRWPWPVWGLSVEGGFNQGGHLEEKAAVAISRVGGWSRGHYRWSFTPELRGRYPKTKPLLVTGFPFGLWKASKLVEVSSHVIAWPLRFPLPPLPLPSGTHSWVGQPSECTEGSLGHRTTVRPFRHGDSMRQIHWAKTALYDKLVSYDREGLAISDATITLDTHGSFHPDSGPDSTLEWMVRIAASIGDALHRQGISVLFVSPADRFRLEPGVSNPKGMLDWLAVLDSEDSDADKTRANAGASRFLKALTVHLTTDLADAACGDSIVLLTETDHTARSCKPQTAEGWMDVRPGADVPLQIRRAWRNGPRRVRYAS